MLKKVVVGCVAVLLIVVSNGINCNADDKSFVWTYEYATLAKEKLELEAYITTEIPDIGNMSASSWKWQLEIEYGVTDNFDMAIYEMFTQKIGAINIFEYEGFKLRARYKLFQKNQLPVDILLYLEMERSINLSIPAVIEGKIILAHTEGSLDLAYNQVIKQNTDTIAVAAHSYTAGAAYGLDSWIKVGIELKGSYSTGKHYLGPTISFITPTFYLNSGIVKGIHIGSNEVQTRTIFGIMF
ncbi:MAG: hypothetical protein A2044_04835 [Candidatus Firestonebacteria bacterium GWA2_43_8]|nr:MAG: hypothetical protein A2044_04835 [Candidatus Firestonebacteria bacterium GWA2_43_8]